ncbi:MAG: RNA polymerase sigma factor [Solirubrobacteraceae bacterium]|nr:RNA polymerase sigma factor [Solirubrobacteraceae bacterium]
MASTGPSDAELLGDRTAPAESFSLFYRRHARAVLAYCARQGLSAHDAADATADVFVAALAGRYRFVPTEDGVATPWLYGIASNVVNGRRRRSARERAAHQELREQPFALTERDIAEYAELRAEVNEALDAIKDLPEPQRSAVIGRHIDGTDYALIAQRDGVSEQVVRQRVSRALAALRARMGGRTDA